MPLLSSRAFSRLARTIPQHGLIVYSRPAVSAAACRFIGYSRVTNDVVTSTTTRRMFGTDINDKNKMNTAHIHENVPSEDYYHGHLMADHLEYLDDMIEKTMLIESSMDELKETYNTKRDMITSVKWMESGEIEELFNKSAAQKKQIKEQLGELKILLKQAKGRAMHGVSAPDGTSDDMNKSDMDAIDEIIEYAKTHENKEAIDSIHAEEIRAKEDAAKIIAVDGPDGIADVTVQLGFQEDMQVIDEVIEYAKIHENKAEIEKLHAMKDRAIQDAAKITAVDAPDGIPDAFVQETLNDIKSSASSSKTI